MRVHHLSVDFLGRRRRTVLHGQKHAPDELLQADGERRPRVKGRVRRQLAGYEPNIVAEGRQVVLDEMSGDEVAGTGNASNFGWKRARVYPRSCVNHVRLTPLRASSWSPPTGRGLGAAGDLGGHHIPDQTAPQPIRLVSPDQS